MFKSPLDVGCCVACFSNEDPWGQIFYTSIRARIVRRCLVALDRELSGLHTPYARACRYSAVHTCRDSYYDKGTYRVSA